jgi:hypothetical protein
MGLMPYCTPSFAFSIKESVSDNLKVCVQGQSGCSYLPSNDLQKRIACDTRYEIAHIDAYSNGKTFCLGARFKFALKAISNKTIKLVPTF